MVSVSLATIKTKNRKTKKWRKINDKDKLDEAKWKANKSGERKVI